MVGHFDVLPWVFLDVVPSFLQDTFHHVIIERPVVQCPLTGIFQPLVTDLFGQVEYTQA